jgi:hypothetical protein
MPTLESPLRIFVPETERRVETITSKDTTARPEPTARSTDLAKDIGIFLGSILAFFV